MRNILSAFQNLMSLKQVRTGHANLVEPNLNRKPVKTACFFRWTRTEPEPFIFEIIEPEPNQTFNISNLWTWTEPEPLNFGATEPEPNLNPNFGKVLNLNRNWTVEN